MKALESALNKKKALVGAFSKHFETSKSPVDSSSGYILPTAVPHVPPVSCLADDPVSEGINVVATSSGPLLLVLLLLW